MNSLSQLQPLWTSTYPNYKVLDIEAGEVSDILYKEFLVSTEDGRMMGFGEKLKRHHT